MPHMLSRWIWPNLMKIGNLTTDDVYVIIDKVARNHQNKFFNYYTAEDMYGIV